MRRVLCAMTLSVASTGSAQTSSSFEDVNFSTSLTCSTASVESNSHTYYWDMTIESTVTDSGNQVQNTCLGTNVKLVRGGCSRC